MKKLFNILMILAAICQTVSAQSLMLVTKDSVWQSNKGGRFYENRLVEWNTGESSLNVELRGDTLTLFNNYLQKFISEGGQMSALARDAARFDRNITAMNRQNTDVLAFIGRDVLDTITARFAGPLLQSGWTIKDTAATLDVSFSVNGQGQLRYQIQGFPTRNALLIGSSVLRLNNYQTTGQSLDFFLAQGGNWFTLENKTKLRLPGNQDVANRALNLSGSSAETIKLEPNFVPEKKSAKKKKKG